MLTDQFDYHLPLDLIAQQPAHRRDASRLMVLRRGAGSWEHRQFAELPDLLEPTDLLVRNNSRVIPARLLGHRERTGGKWEGLYLQEAASGTWELLTQTRGRLEPGEWVAIETGLRLQLVEKCGRGRWLARPESPKPTLELLARHGSVPLPPYIRKGQEAAGDRERYQTIYAAEPGSVAAPTAGLHFTSEVFDGLARRGISWLDVTLHVGLGTFRPIEATEIDQHVLHSEWASLSAASARILQTHRQAGGRVVAVGTTAARTLETAASSGTYRCFEGSTNLYLCPGHAFQGLDALLTNFHLPRSSLLVLVAALAGHDLTLQAYRAAVEARYRFFSYGDAMLVLP